MRTWLAAVPLLAFASCGDGSSAPGADDGAGDVPGDATDVDAGNEVDAAAPSDARWTVVASGTLGPEGGKLSVPSSAADFADAELAAVPGALAAPVTLELRVYEDLGGGQLMEPVLAVVSSGVLSDGVTMSVPARSRLGLPNDQLSLWAFGMDSYDWIEVVPPPRADGVIAKLVAGFGEIGRAGQDLVARGFHTVFGDTLGENLVTVLGVAAGNSVIDIPTAVLAGGAIITLYLVGNERVRNLYQSTRLEAPPGMTLEEFFCGSGDRVLQVHGVTSNHRDFEGGLIPHLRGLGYAVATYDYASAYAIDRNGHFLAELLDLIVRDRSTEPVPVVAHSMGNLVTRAAMQNFGATQWLDRLVMLAPPNGGGDMSVGIALVSRAIAPLTTILVTDAMMPGLGDMQTGGRYLAGLNDDAAVAPYRSRYWVLTGWSEGAGPSATDSWVEIGSALVLPLPAGHELYFSAEGEPPAPAAHDGSAAQPGFGDWDGVPHATLTHSNIHELIGTNGVGPHLREFLSAERACDCAGRGCGTDGCGNECGPPCCSAPIEQIVYLSQVGAELQPRLRMVLPDAPPDTGVDLWPIAFPGENPNDYNGITCAALGGHVALRGEVSLGKTPIYLVDGTGVSELPAPDGLPSGVVPEVSQQRDQAAWVDSAHNLHVYRYDSHQEAVYSTAFRAAAGYDLAFAPSGRKLAISAHGNGVAAIEGFFDRETNQAVVLDLVSGGTVPAYDWSISVEMEVLGTRTAWPQAIGVSFLPSNDRVLFATDEDLLATFPLSPEETAVGVEIAEAVLGEYAPAAPLTSRSGDAMGNVKYFPFASPSGDWVLFWSGNRGEEGSTLRVMRRGQGTARVLHSASQGRACWLRL